MIIVTTNDLPGYEVFGLTVRSRNVGSRIGASLKSRYDSSELGTTWTEICAYGTAVEVRKL